jgi:hypothetical protein
MQRHYNCGKMNPNWNGGIKLHSDGYMMTFLPKHPRASDGYVFNHILKAERILKKPLPKNAVIHHHTPEQLVICENNAYHRFLHRRINSYIFSGNVHWKKCVFCKEYDSPNNLKCEINKKTLQTRFYHSKCINFKHREYYYKNKEVK